MAVSGITTSYVSSSAYYGFIPQNNHNENQLRDNSNNNNNNNNHNSNSSSWDVNVNMKQDWIENNQPQTGAMETDDDYHNNSRNDVNIVNNYCVISPQVLRGINPAVYHSNCNIIDGQMVNTMPGFVGSPDRQTPRQDAGLRRNRKRNNDGELMMFVEPDQLKRLRKGSGNRGSYNGRGYSKDGGLAKVYYKSSRLCINRGRHCFDENDYFKDDEEVGDDEEGELATIESCCWAAGNHSSLVNLDDKKDDKDLLLFDNRNSKLKRFQLESNDLEYENMLLETHGCSAYHHQRLQSENDIAESEF